MLCKKFYYQKRINLGIIFETNEIVLLKTNHSKAHNEKNYEFQLEKNLIFFLDRLKNF